MQLAGVRPPNIKKGTPRLAAPTVSKSSHALIVCVHVLCVILAQNAVGSSTYARGLRTFGRSFKAFLQVHVCVFVSEMFGSVLVRVSSDLGVCVRVRESHVKVCVACSTQVWTWYVPVCYSSSESY